MAGAGATGADPAGGRTVTARLTAGLRFAPRRLMLIAALVAAWPVLNAVLPSGLPAGVVLQGVVLGSLTGLSAVGLVLVYRACRIVNFAQATLGSAAGVLATQLFQHRGWNYYAAFAAGLATAAIVGALADRLVIQRFFWAPRLVLTVATIGLAQILSGVELTLPGLFGG
ncbi:MAG: branched-chain amino acid transport system permease protein livM, partial [Actinomycetota bacterium]|nr:branched-chain amino acid transport system permease protein livM [Actinomycetota bacterium]